MSNSTRWFHSPGILLLISFIALIIIGTGLLSLPSAQVYPLSFFDVLFTATSATCVTGLLTIPLTAFTFFGQCILLVLIQLGGLGLITMTLFAASFLLELGLSTQLMAGKLLDINGWHNCKKILAYIIIITLIAETIGACVMGIDLATFTTLEHPWFMATFQSVSSFCHAGIILTPEDAFIFGRSPLILGISMLLMLAGGIGFITWREVAQALRAAWYHKRFRFSLHSRIIFYTTIILTLVPTIIFWSLEQNHSLHGTDIFHSISNTLFNVVTSRGGGMFTIAVEDLQHATLFMITMLAFIGAAPVSTGSGIKLTTVALIYVTIRSVIEGKTAVTIQGRTISVEQTYKAMTIFVIGITWIALSTFLLLITDADKNTWHLIFESFSAYTNLGSSLHNTTPTLSLIGKSIIMISMLVGRIGSLTLLFELKSMIKKETAEFSYPLERVMLG